MRPGVFIIGAIMWVQFQSLWWASVLAMVLMGLAVGLCEAEVNRLNAELLRYRSGQAPDRERQAELDQKAGDVFLRRLHLSARKQASGQTPDS